MVPVEEADDAEEAEEESSSCCSSVSKRSACSSSSPSSKMTGGIAGRPVSLDLANALWRSLMVCRFCWTTQHATQPPTAALESLLLFPSYQHMLRSRRNLEQSTRRIYWTWMSVLVVLLVVVLWNEPGLALMSDKIKRGKQKLILAGAWGGAGSLGAKTNDAFAPLPK